MIPNKLSLLWVALVGGFGHSHAELRNTTWEHVPHSACWVIPSELTEVGVLRGASVTLTPLPGRLGVCFVLLQPPELPLAPDLGPGIIAWVH